MDPSTLSGLGWPAAMAVAGLVALAIIGALADGRKRKADRDAQRRAEIDAAGRACADAAAGDDAGELVLRADAWRRGRRVRK